jgi:hypothetical protein
LDGSWEVVLSGAYSKAVFESWEKHGKPVNINKLSKLSDIIVQQNDEIQNQQTNQNLMQPIVHLVMFSVA